MAEFLQLIESIQQEKADVARLFGGEGRSVRNARKDPKYLADLAEAANFTAEIWEGKRPLWQLQEALSTSDFPNLFGDILDRQLLANYVEVPQTYRDYARIATVRDFRTVKRFYVTGSESVLSPVAQQAEYPMASLSDGFWSYAVQKYGRAIPISWETIVNDDLDALRSIPDRFARAARRTEEKFATGLFVDANGPHASFFTDANKNRMTVAVGAATANPALSISALQDAYKLLAAQKDADGEPIVIDVVTLVVPPALQIVAQNILNATQLFLNTAGGALTGLANSSGQEQRLQVANWMQRKTTLCVNPYIPVIATTNGNTSWFLFASPSSGRPALEVGFLAGHASPELFMKDSGQVRVGGGAVDPMNGDFESDSVMYKIRHVLGGATMDPKMAMASNGSGA